MEKDKVIVERDSIPRCGWCGTFYSPNWVQLYPNSPQYCSHECLAATSFASDKSELMHRIECQMCAVVVTVFFGALLFSYPTAAPIWIAGVIFSVFCFCLGMGSSRMNKEALKYQYRKDMYRDSYQVLIECEFCSHLNPPDTLDCQHCDGPLSNSQTVQGEIPDWLKPETVRIQNRYKCTHCDAVYGYDSIKEDGSVICQNCRRSFLPESDELG